MHTFTRFTSRAAVAVAAASLLAFGVSVAPAHAHGAPTPGSSCPMSGATEFVHGMTYVCTGTMSAKPTWGKGLPASNAPLAIGDGWAKAADAGAMSATFGKIVNTSNKPVTVIAASSPYSGVMQLHEVVMSNGAMVMQQKPGGFTIAPGASFELKPGGNHIMFMKLNKAITAGSMVPVTLITSTGGRVKVWALAKVFLAGNENYNGSNSNGMGGNG